MDGYVPVKVDLGIDHCRIKCCKKKERSKDEKKPLGILGDEGKSRECE